MIDCKLFKNSVLIRIKSKSLGNVRKVEVSREAAEKLVGPKPLGMSDADREKQVTEALKRLKASKKMIVAEELDAITAFMAETKQTVLRRFCNPSFVDDGLYTVAKSVVGDVVEYFKLANARLDAELIPAFAKVYEDKLKEAEKVFNGAFEPAEFPAPDQLSNAFGLSYRIVELDVPEGLPPEIREQEEKKLRETFEAAEQAITAALWAEFQEIIAHVAERLESSADGKRKTFRDSTFGNMVEFMEAMKNRNVFSDERLAGLVGKAKAIVDAIGGKPSETADRLRNYDSLRAETQKAFVALKEQVDKSIADLPVRVFSFEE